MRRLKYIFFIVVIAIVGLFVVSQIVAKPDSPKLGGSIRELDVVTTQVDQGDSPFMRFEVRATLPENLTENDNSIYVIGRETTAYIDGVQRIKYEGNLRKTYGKTATAYVEIPISTADAGKELLIDVYIDKGVSTVYIGDRLTFWTMIQLNYVPELLLGIVALTLSILTIIGGIWVSVKQKTFISIIDLGVGSALASAWVITNSVFREVMFTNISIVSNMPFFFIATVAFPYLCYVNEVQNRRYEKGVKVIQFINIVDIFFCIGIYIFDVTELSKVFPIIASGAVITILTIIVTLVIDIIKKNISEYSYAAAGLMSVMLCGVFQIFMYFFRFGVFSGIVLAVGLIIMIIFSVIHAFSDFSKMNRATINALEANRAKDVFLANMSHEIRTPINAILGMDEMIIRESKDKDIRCYALDVRSAGRNLLDIINDILDFSKIESGMMKIVPVEYDVKGLLHDILLMIRVKADEKMIKIVPEIDPEIPNILKGDEVRLRQIFVNLLSNAVKYTEEGSIVWRIRSEISGDDVKLHCEVEDTGIGMTPEDLEHLFERFVRADERKNYNVEGTGLGLPITAQLLDLMGSKLEVKSEYRKGSKFSFVLLQGVINYEPVGSLESIETYTKPEEQSEVFKGSGHILVTDDQRMNRVVLKGLLKGSGLEIDEAVSGAQCLKMCEEKEYDIVFLDHMMPEMDGMETFRLLKHDVNRMGEPVIIAMTANAAVGADGLYKKAGFDDYLSKPVIPDELNRMLFRYLGEKSETPSYIEAPKEKTLPVRLNTPTYELPNEFTPAMGIDFGYAMQHFEMVEDLKQSIREFYENIYPLADDLDEEYKRLKMDYGNGPEIRITMENIEKKVAHMKEEAYRIGAVSVGGVGEYLEVQARDKNLASVLEIVPHFLAEWMSYKKKLEIKQ